MVKNVFLISSRNLPSLSLIPLLLVLLQQGLLESLSPSFLYVPFRYWKAAIRCPCSLLSFRLNSSNSLSLFSKRGSPALGLFFWPSSGPAPTVPCVFCAEGSRAGHRTPGGVSPEQSRGTESPPSTCWPLCFWCSPGCGWPSGLWAHIVGSCLAFHPPVPPSPSPQGCSQSLHPPAFIDTRDCPNPNAGPYIWPCWTSWGSQRPTSPACPGSSGWYPVLLVCQLHHSVFSLMWKTIHCLLKQYIIRYITVKMDKFSRTGYCFLMFYGLLE